MKYEKKIDFLQTEIGPIPKDWTLLKIKDCFNINTSSLKNSTDGEMQIKYIDIESVQDGTIKGYKEYEFKDAPSRARRIVKKGDVILSTVRPNLKAFAIIKESVENLVCSTGFAVLNSKQSNRYFNEYLYHFALSEVFMSQVNNFLVGTNYPAINLKDLESIIIPLPPFYEQKKISKILELVDFERKKIELKICELTKLKSALAKKLLSEGIGHTEFVDSELGGIPKGWRVKKLSDVVSFRNGKAHEKDIDTEGDYVVVNSKFISTEGEIRKYSKDCIEPLYKDEIVMVMSDVPNGKAIAKCFYIDKDNKYTLNQRICGLTAKNINSKYLMYVINRNAYYLKFDDGVKQTNLRKGEVLNCPIKIPPIIEQVRIANIIDAMNNYLKLFICQKNDYAQLKRGLMQQLLTGKIRV